MTQHATSKIITSGLKFYFDSGNLKKSFTGIPITNVVPDASQMSGWTNYYRTENASTFLTEFGTVGYRFSSQPTWNGVYRGITLPSTGTYTISAWFRYWGGSPNNNGCNVYTSGGGIGDTSAGADKSKIGQWQRVSMTRTYTTTSLTFYIISWGGTDNGASDHSTWEVTMPQIELNSYASPFVNGTRSSTNSLQDLTGNYTLTPSNIVYNSDDTFNFNGSNSCYDLNTSNLITGNNPFTIESIYYTSATDSGGRAILGNYGSGYTGSGQLWYATHGFYLGGATPYHTGAPLRNGTYHSAVTRDTVGNVRLYKNGVLDLTGTNTNAIASNINWRVGKDVNGDGEPFVGKIYQVRVYDKVLSDSEILQNFIAMKGRFGL